MLITIPIR